jgi:hypothetical protein
MKSKKILAGFCASLMLAAATLPSVSAADAVKVKVGSAEAKAGEDFTVAIDLSDIPSAGINGCDFGIQYDADVVELTGVTTGAIAKEDSAKLDGVEPLEVGYESGFVSIIYALSSDAITESGTFLNVKGTVKSTAKAGDKSELKIVAIDRKENSVSTSNNADIIFGMLNTDETSVMYTPTITDGVVEVIGEENPSDKPSENPSEDPSEDPSDKPSEDPSEQPGNVDPSKRSMLGDVDLDKVPGKTNDAILLAKYIANKNKYPLSDEALANADVNLDNAVGTADLTMLVEVVLGKISLS